MLLFAHDDNKNTPLPSNVNGPLDLHQSANVFNVGKSGVKFSKATPPPHNHALISPQLRDFAIFCDFTEFFFSGKIL